jgi:XTP/dITP diphosphohydrolase
MLDRLLIATGNAGKLREIQQVFAAAHLPPIDLLTLADLADRPDEPEETGATFEENAALKARYYARRSGLWCLADDSGLEVDALAGEPGVRSARYAGVDAEDRGARDRANNAKLLAALAEVPTADRSARFVCVMCLADPAGAVRFTTRGTMEGRIGEEPRGENGFGYDPLLALPEGRRVAELEAAEKNARSHRGQAARRVAAHLAEQHAAGNPRPGD